jgi:ABC-type anion transport system duplicated permease subunit
MSMTAKPAYGLSALLFAGFVANLFLGRNGSAFFENDAEMLLLAASATAFGIGTLLSEAREKTAK